MRTFHYTILALIAVWPVWAATPASGTIDDEHPSTSWTGRFIAPNPGGSTVPVICAEDLQPLTCDVFRFDVKISDANVEDDSIKIELAWTNSQMDIDLYVYNDETNEEVGSGTAGAGVADSAFIPAINGRYRVEVIPWAAVGESYEGTVTFERFEEKRAFGTSGGATSAALLIMLTAFGLARRAAGTLRMLTVVGLLLPAAAMAQDARCTLPGELVSEDAAGDQLTPLATFADIHSLHMAEPDGGPNLVFTFKMANLAMMPPNTLWAVRFITDVPPADAAEYFVAMLTDPAGHAHFVHGTAAPPAGQAGLLFTPAGPLDASSHFKPDGTITLALDKTQVGGLEPGGFVFGMIPITHRITPTDGTMPFAYGYRSLSSQVVAWDDAADGFYEVAGSAACGGGKSVALNAGAMNLLLLLPLMLLALLRRRAI